MLLVVCNHMRFLMSGNDVVSEDTKVSRFDAAMYDMQSDPRTLPGRQLASDSVPMLCLGAKDKE